MSVIICIIPVINFTIPYMYELYVINNCNYLLKYNYQNGIVLSNNTYIAIINNKPIPITLQSNLFNRKEENISELNYNIIYGNDIEISLQNSNDKIIVDNEDIKKIALDAKKRCDSARGAHIDYFLEGNFAIICMTAEETHGERLGEYFYYDNTYIENIRTYGNLESIIYYK